MSINVNEWMQTQFSLPLVKASLLALSSPLAGVDARFGQYRRELASKDVCLHVEGCYLHVPQVGSNAAVERSDFLQWRFRQLHVPYLPT